MPLIDLRVHPSSARLPAHEQFAWKLAELAANAPTPEPDVSEMMGCRVIDNVAVAVASLERAPVAAARAQALAHPRAGGASLIGLAPGQRVHAEWAAWANATATRELDYHDTFLAADYAHPGDNIAPLVAVAQQTGCDGASLSRAIMVAYEVHVALVKSISLHAFKKDHVAHLCPATAAGLGALLKLPIEQCFHAINQAVHLSFSTRQSRKGEISSWKAFVPGFSGKTAIEAVDRAMRGEASPSPVYEGEDSVIAWMLGGSDAHYEVDLPSPGAPMRGIVETYTKAHSAEYQAQAIIDLAFELRSQFDPADIESVLLKTSHHTHTVIGSGANDPQKYDPQASRETLDHSIPYILAVALEDGHWHHESSYTRERATRPSTLALWQRITTVEDEQWTRRYNEPDPSKRCFGGRLEVRLRDGRLVSGEKHAADAHPNGQRPWGMKDYIGKLELLCANRVDGAELDSFVQRATSLNELDAAKLQELYPRSSVSPASATRGIFDWPEP